MRFDRPGATNISLARPRGLIGNIRASAPPPDTAATIRALTEGFEKFKAKYDARHDDIEAHIKEVNLANAVDKIHGGRDTFAAVDPEYSAAFRDHFRTGRNEADVSALEANGDRGVIKAAMQEGSDSDGGYIAPTEWDRRINKSLVSVSPLRRLCDVQTTTNGAYSTLWKVGEFGTGWVGETANRPATVTPTFAPLVFGHGEIYANAYATQRILDDSAIDLEKWLTGEVEDEFARQESIAFLSGDGSNKPYGMLLYATGGTHAARHPGGAVAVKPSGAAADLTVDALIGLTYDLWAPYRPNATWLMNSQTASKISSMKDGSGSLIWRDSLAVGQPATLLGRPVEFDEGMPQVGAGNLPIAFGDFRSAYVINDRTGVRVLRDPYSAKPYVTFYVTKRVGGGLKDPAALKFLKIAAS